MNQKVLHIKLNLKVERSLGHFADDLCRLTDKASPNLQYEAHGELALSRNLDQINQPQISFVAKQHHLRNLPDTVSSITELELYLPREQPVRAVSYNNTLNPQVTPVQPIGDQSLLQQLLGD